MNPTLRNSVLASPSQEVDAIVESGDGVLAFSLTRCHNGVYIQRYFNRPGEHRCEVAVTLSDHSALRRWLAHDPRRFDYPLVFERVARSFGLLLQPAGTAGGFDA
jgi:hypothetical protein